MDLIRNTLSTHDSSQLGTPKLFILGPNLKKKPKNLLKEVEERTTGESLCEFQQRRSKQQSTQKFALHPSRNKGKSWRSSQLELHC